VTDYLTLIEVLAIHEDQIARYGGASGLRDPGANMTIVLCAEPNM